MAEKKGVGHAYNIDFLNVVFAASSLFLFLSVIWMVWDDFDRDWKNTQRRFAELEYAGDAGAASSRRRAASTRTSWRSSQAQLAAAAEERRGQPAEGRRAARRSWPSVDARLYARAQDYQFAKATYDQDRYDFEAARAAGASERRSARARRSPSWSSALTELNLAGREDRPPSATALQTAARRSSPARSPTIAEADRRAARRADAAAASASTSSRRALVKDYFRERAAARLHGADDQGPADHPAERRRRRELHRGCAKMDRCQTCHLAIDRQGYEKYPQPFTTHPNLRRYLGSDSPHPIDQVGCTVCHEGMGQSVSFRDAAHTPRDREAEARVGGEVPLGRAAPVGLPDAADEA